MQNFKALTLNTLAHLKSLNTEPHKFLKNHLWQTIIIGKEYVPDIFDSTPQMKKRLKRQHVTLIIRQFRIKNKKILIFNL